MEAVPLARVEGAVKGFALLGHAPPELFGMTLLLSRVYHEFSEPGIIMFLKKQHFLSDYRIYGHCLKSGKYVKIKSICLFTLRQLLLQLECISF